MCPENFDVCLFAVDLVNFVFLDSYKQRSESAVKHCPNFVCKSFNGTLKKAVLLIKDSVKLDVDEDFCEFQQRNDLRTETFFKYAMELRSLRFRKGFDAEMFLCYSVYVAFLAYRFCSGGSRNAQVSAVSSIADYFSDCNMTYCLWEVLGEIAERIACEASNDGSLPPNRILSRELSAGINYFLSPDIERRNKMSIDRTDADSGVKTLRSTTMDCLLDSQNMSKSSNIYGNENSINSCRSTKRRTKEYYERECNPMPSLCEYLECSLEQLSVSSTLPLKLVKGEDYPNSTPANYDIKRKPGILKKRTPKSSLERQIFKLSPINVNKVKTESIIWKE